MTWPGWEKFTPDGRAILELPKRNKFNARTRCIGGVTFGSGKEARRWVDLVALQSAGIISDLKPHPSYELVVNGIRVGKFTPDSTYVTAEGEVVIEDVKGGKSTRTEAYSLRKRLFEACHYPLRVTEV